MKNFNPKEQSSNDGNLKARLIDAGLVVAGVAMVCAPLFAQAAFLDRQLDLKMTGSDVSAL